MGYFEKPPYYLSAYGLAVNRGFEGSEEEWLESLKGEPAKLDDSKITYQVSESGRECPAGVWVDGIPEVPQGMYLWTRLEQKFNSGDYVTVCWPCRYGVDGSDGADGLGSLVSVNEKKPDGKGNLTLSAKDVGAAAQEHDHSGYAKSNHGHEEYAASGHTHDGYAASGHTHDGYAASSHKHAASDVNSGTFSAERLPTVPMTKGGTGAANGATGLKNLLAAGATVLSAKQFGTALPSAGTAGRLFFKKVT